MMMVIMINWSSNWSIHCDYTSAIMSHLRPYPIDNGYIVFPVTNTLSLSTEVRFPGSQEETYIIAW